MSLQEALQALSSEWKDRAKALRIEQLASVGNVARLQRHQPSVEFLRCHVSAEMLDQCTDQIERLLGDYWQHI